MGSLAPTVLLLLLSASPLPGQAPPFASGPDLVELRARILEVNDGGMRPLAEEGARLLRGEEAVLDGTVDALSGDGTRRGTVRYRLLARFDESRPGEIALSLRSDATLVESRGFTTGDIGVVRARRETMRIASPGDTLFELYVSSDLRARVVAALSWRPLVPGQAEAAVDPLASVLFRLRTLFRELPPDGSGAAPGGASAAGSSAGETLLEETELRSIGGRAAVYALERSGPAVAGGPRPQPGPGDWESRNVQRIRVPKAGKPREPTRRERREAEVEAVRRRARGGDLPAAPDEEEVLLRLTPLYVGRREIRLRIELRGEFVFPGAGVERRFDRVLDERALSGDRLRIDLLEVEPALAELGGSYVFEISPVW